MSDAVEATPNASLPVGDDLPLIFHLDNTTLHRLQYVINPDVSPKTDIRVETLNVLHLLEALILADEIVVCSFESESSQEISDQLISLLSPLKRASGSCLLQEEVHSDWESQLEIACDAAAEIYDRRILSFNPLEDGKLTAGIDVSAARPEGVVEPTARFWTMVSNGGMDSDEVVARGAGEVHLHRTDGLFLFGVAQHEDFRKQILRSYKRFGAWPEEHWNRLHVLFRAISNQRIADRSPGAIYNPPPVRAELLNRVSSLALRRFQETLNELAVSVSQRVSPGALSEYLNGFKIPIPVLGLAALPAGPKSAEGLIERVLMVREEAADLRESLRKLNALYLSGDTDEAFRRIEKEAQELKKGVSERLGLKETTTLPYAAVDSAVELSDFGQAKVPKLESAVKILDWIGSLVVRRRKRVRFLANLLARGAEESGLSRAERFILRRK